LLRLGDFNPPMVMPLQDQNAIKKASARPVSLPLSGHMQGTFNSKYIERAGGVTAQGRQGPDRVPAAGPHTKALPLCQTEQALLQVIDAALGQLILVSYAVYKIPPICNALIRAADRGVSPGIILEAPARHEGKHAYNTLRALGAAAARRSAVYLWPFAQRGIDASGKVGVLPVKCAVADSRWLFLSSANLTDYAFTVNMELGMLITCVLSLPSPILLPMWY
jgi:phosphatidylserine/phosphatidylglycerophosphate/cardiolipin synthase-like enzyme